MIKTNFIYITLICIALTIINIVKSNASDKAFPFGPFHLLPGDYGPPFTCAFYAAQNPDGLIELLETARSKGFRVVIHLAGSRRFYQNEDSSFSIEKFTSSLEIYKDVNLESYINDSTIIAHLLFDEPQDPSNWDGNPVPYELIDSAAGVSKRLFPKLPVCVGGPPSFLIGGAPYRNLDLAFAQYTIKYGNIDNWYSNEVDKAKEGGIGLIFSLNVLSGGTSQQPMTSEQLLLFGSKLMKEPYAKALLMWKWDSAYFSQPDIINAIDSLGKLAYEVVPLAPLRSYPISIHVTAQIIDYANEIFRQGDQAGISPQWISLAPQILKAQRSLVSPSLAVAKLWNDSMFTNIDVFAYNFEHWPYTPEEEQADPRTASENAKVFAREKGLEYFLVPDRSYSNSNGAEMVKFADAFGIQMQRLQHDPVKFTDTLRYLTGQIRASNPSVKIWVQIGAQVTGEARTVREMLTAADSARRYMDGLAIFYGSEVDTLKAFISLLRGVTNISEDKNKKNNDLVIYPNPAENEFSVEGINTDEIASITLSDVLGNEVLIMYKSELNYNISNNTITIGKEKLSELCNGMYILRVISNKDMSKNTLIQILR